MGDLRKHALACVLVAVVPRSAAADTPPPTRAISAGIDVGARSSRDDLIVPRASTGPSFGLTARFLGEEGPGLVESELRFGAGTLFDRDGRPAVSLFHAMRLGYFFYARRSQPGWSLAAGPLLAWETDVLWLAKWDDAHAYWLGRRWLGVGARGWHRLPGDMRVDVRAESSVMGFESRPPTYRYRNEDPLARASFYFADVNEHPAFGTIASWQAMRLEIDFSKSPASAVDAPVPLRWSLGLETRVAHTDSPASAFVLESTIRLAYAWSVR